MAKVTGDLWPQASGTASLGSDQRGLDNFGNEIRPFAHVHMNSGVFHNPINALSGIIRYKSFPEYGEDEVTQSPPINSSFDGFDFSFDGGESYDLGIGSNDFSDLRTSTGRVIIRANNDKHLTFISSGILMVTDNSVLVRSNLDFEVIAPDSSIVATIDLNLQNTEGPARLSADRGAVSISAGTPDFEGGQIFLRAFANSGVHEYRFGPHQSWWIKTTHSSTGGPDNDGYWPIAHSGNVNQMINQIGLQNAYNAGHRIIINSTIGDLELISDTAKTKLSSTTTAPLNISGVYTRPTTSLELGDMYMMAHSAIENLGTNTTAASLAESQARSLGLATPVINTGSGVINISTGSGVAQFLNTAVMQVTTVAQTLPLVAASQASDRNYGLGSIAAGTSGVVTIFSPGLYKATYKVLANKTIGATPQTVRTSALLNGANVLGSVIESFHFDSTTAAQASATATVLFNANAGDLFRLDTLSTAAGADNCSIGIRGALLVIEKIGPKRGTF